MKFFIPFLLFIFQACAPTPGFAADTFNSATVMTGVKAYKNYVKNPNCDSNVLNIGYTSALPPTQTTIGTRHACRWNPAANSKTLTWKINDLDADVSNGANNCAATFSCEGVGGDGSFSAALNYDSVTKDSLTDMGVKSGVWKDYKLQFPCGDTTSTTREIVLTTTASSPGVVVCRNVNFGKYDLQVGTNSTQEADYGAITIGATTTAPTKGVMAVDKVTGHFEGQYWVGTYNFSQTAATGAANGSGDYLIGIPAAVGAVDLTLQQVYTGSVSATGSGLADIGSGHRYDGANIATHAVLYNSSQFRLRNDVLYSSVAFFGAGTNGGPLSTSGTQSWSVQVKVPIVGRSSVTVVQPDQTDYGWTDYTPTFTGFGTVTNINCQHKRMAEDLHVDCTFTVGTPTATEARVSLPNSLLPQSSRPSLFKVGTTSSGSTGAAYLTVLAEPANSYLTFGSGSTGAASFSKINGNSLIVGGNIMSFNATIPIQGWINNGRAPSFAGSVTSNISNPYRLEAAAITCGSSSTSDQSWVSVANVSSSRCALTFSGFANKPYCWANTDTASTVQVWVSHLDVTSSTAGSIGCMTQAASTTATCSPANYTLFCLVKR